MKKSPFRNALFAGVYIVLIVSVINAFSSMMPEPEDNLLAPMVMLSLLTLSVAIMGYLFALEPLRMYLDGKKEEAVKFFTHTIAFFAGFAALFVALLLIVSW